MLDYGVPLTILVYGDCTSYNGRIRENVGLQRCWISKVSLYTNCVHTMCRYQREDFQEIDLMVETF